MVDVRHKKGGIVETNRRTISLCITNIHKKPPAFYTRGKPTMNQTKQPILNHPVTAHHSCHPLYDNLPSTGL